MKWFCVPTLLVLACCLTTPLYAQERGCVELEAQIRLKLNKPRPATDQEEVRDLKRELAWARSSCTDAKLREKADTQVARKQARVAQCQMHMEKTRASGKSKAMHAAQNALSEAIAELNEAKARRAELH